MPISLSEFALEIILALVTTAVEKTIDKTALEYFDRLRVKNRVEATVANVVQPLLPFLEHEKISDDKQRRLLQTCVDELRPLSQKPEQLFQGSLNGQKIFENLYAERTLPQVVIEDDVKDIYMLLFPRVAELLCRVPAAIKEWETLAWAENFRRFDEFSGELRAVFNQVDSLKNESKNQADEILARVRRSLTQKNILEMDITTLRGDQSLLGKLSEFFVHPAIRELIDEKDKDKQPKILTGIADDLLQFVSPQQKNIVIGVGGAGKSTWAKWLQRETLKSDVMGFGVRIELRDCTCTSIPAIYDLVRETAGKHFAEELSVEVISRWLDNQLLVFILDGFDEVAVHERDTVYDWITDLCQAARGCPVILTSRPIATDHLDRKGVFDTRWSIEPFDLPRIIDYIQRWYDHAPQLAETDRKMDAAKLANEWQTDPTLTPLTGNPLLLSTLLMVHYLDGRLPPGRSRLYQRYIDGMLGIWDDRRHLMTTTIILTLPQKKQIIRGLALFMFLQERDQLEEAAVLEWLQDFLKSAGISHPATDVLAVLRERSGLIIGPGIYNFAHKSIAEYLVAEIVWDGDQKDLAGQRIDRMYLFEQRDNDRWNSVIFLWGGLAAIADLVAFIDSCLDVKNWALAYGILYDQYDRINDRGTRRRLLMPDLGKQGTALFRDSKLSVWYGVVGGGSPSSTKIMFEVSDMNLRGIIGDADYDDLIELALKTRALTFDDRLVAQPEELVHLIWLSHCDEIIDDVSGLIEYIHARLPLCDSDEEWCIFISQQLVRHALYSDKDIISSFELCHVVLPEYGGLLPLFLLAMISEFF